LTSLKCPTAKFWSDQSIANISDRKHVLVNLLALISQHLADNTVSPNTIRDISHHELAGLLKALAAAAPENARWLKERADAYARDHAMDPRSYPPPVALDWLYVDVEQGSPDATMIWVPPLTCPASSK